MRAVRFDHYGDVDVLDVLDVDQPEPGVGQVRVAVRAAGINPGESKISSGALADRWPASFPEGEGSDFAGVIHATGPGVTGFGVGDEVLGFTDNRASHAEFVVAEAGEIVAKPADLDWSRAGALFVVGTSAYALVHASPLTADDVVLVSAAAGGVGSLTAQWVRALGATVDGLARPVNHQWLHGYGIRPVDYAGDGLADRIRDAVDGRPVTAVLDTHGAEYVQLGLDLGVEPSRIATIVDFAAAEKRVQVVLHSSAATPDVLTEIAEALASGLLELPIAAT